ncbi:MAG: CDGSH iron-sulfur domain-containing protein [Gammaproteobacteria bacterium]|nr:CDGSH iron-sulfur domain-containing protein [Gammaproteobacteria bacterium]
MNSLKPTIYANEPAALQLDPEKEYFWCSCGQSKNQPFCDGSHPEGFEPVNFKPKDGYTVWLCNCKYTRRPPFCDGAHNKLDKLAK